MRRAACVIAVVLVWLGLLGWAAGVRWNTPWSPTQTMTLPARSFHVVMGAAVEDGDALRVGAVGNDGNALQSMPLDSIRARDWPILRYRFDGFSRSLELSLVFRRADKPADVQVATLPWPGDGWRSVDLRKVPGWHGDITELGFAEYATPQIAPPALAFRSFRFDSVQLWSGSLRGNVAALVTSWRSVAPWALMSISALGPQRETAQAPPLTPLLAFATILSLIVCAIALGWSRRQCLHASVIAAALVWVALDLRWLRDFQVKHLLTEQVYAGKSWDERQRLQPDQNIAFMASQVGDWLAAQPTPPHVLIASDSSYIFLRLIYLLLPHNAALLQLTDAAPLPRDSLIVLYASTVWHYDATRGAIVGAGRDYPADPVFNSGLLRVFRLRSAAP